MPLIDFFGGMFYDRMEQEEAKIMSVLKFKCRCCNSFHDIKRTVPTGFSGWSYPGMEWSDFTDEVPPLTQERWRITEEVKKIGSNNIPNVGDVRTVRVMLPFEEEIGSEFYMDYMPVSAYLDSFETANQFENSAIVKCRFTEIISADDYNAWIKVKVLDVIMFPQLAEAFPAYKTEESLEDFGTICSCNDIDADDAPWKLISWNAQGDVYEGKVIFTDAGGVAHIVWLNIEDFFTHISYFGNIIKT